MRVIDSTDARRYVVTDFGDGIHNRIDVYQYERCLVELVAHHTTSFREAWNEKPSPLCNLSREVIEVNLNDHSSEESPNLLSACTESKAREYLWKAVRHPIVMEIGVRLFLRELELRQRINPEAAGIVFTGSDYDQESNKHAKEVERFIAEMNPALHCSIVTMKTQDLGVLGSDVAIAQMLANHGAVFGLHQAVVVGMAGAGLGLLDEQFAQQVAEFIDQYRPALEALAKS